MDSQRFENSKHRPDGELLVNENLSLGAVYEREKRLYCDVQVVSEGKEMFLTFAWDAKRTKARRVDDTRDLVRPGLFKHIVGQVEVAFLNNR